MSFSPRGRLFGLMTDLALWRAGRSANAKVSRVEYDGEGITAFPGTPLPGQLFARGSSIVWSSDLDTARRAVDLVVARERATGPSADGTASAPAAAATPAVIALLPPGTGHTLVGAIAGDSGTPARCLAILPGDALDVSEEELARADLSFVFDATSDDVAAGEVALSFPAGTPSPTVVKAAEVLSRRLASLKWGQVVFEATPRVEPPRAVIAVKASGLTTVYGGLLKEAMKMQKTLQKAGKGSDEVEPEDPNQSSSTFQ